MTYYTENIHLFNLRQSIYNRFRDWKLDAPVEQQNKVSAYGRSPRHLCWILGRTQSFNMLEMSPEELDICQALLGVHGLTVYKMLLIRRGG